MLFYAFCEYSHSKWLIRKVNNNNTHFLGSFSSRDGKKIATHLRINHVGWLRTIVIIIIFQQLVSIDPKSRKDNKNVHQWRNIKTFRRVKKLWRRFKEEREVKIMRFTCRRARFSRGSWGRNKKKSRSLVRQWTQLLVFCKQEKKKKEYIRRRRCTLITPFELSHFLLWLFCVLVLYRPKKCCSLSCSNAVANVLFSSSLSSRKVSLKDYYYSLWNNIFFLLFRF